MLTLLPFLALTAHADPTFHTETAYSGRAVTRRAMTFAVCCSSRRVANVNRPRPSRRISSFLTSARSSSLNTAAKRRSLSAPSLLP